MLANVVIAKNKAQFPKNVFSDNEMGEKIKIFRSFPMQTEANFVKNIWEQHNSHQRKFTDFKHFI